jgi:uncharacterized protein (TIGR02118 family)
MIKTIAVARRKAGMSHEEFIKYWREEHAPLVKKIWPGLRKYVQNEIIVQPGQKREADGIVEMWYDNADEMKKAMPGYSQMLESLSVMTAIISVT